MKRISSIDVVRGIAMIIMALDHVRDLMHINSVDQSPTDLGSTTPLLFFTRWITHLCAPIFVFLAGTSAFISLKNKYNFVETKRQLLFRGVWLILLEFTVVNFAIFFDIGFHTVLFEVIAAIGFGFVMLSFLLKVSSNKLGVLGIAIISCHNLLPLIPFEDTSILKAILTPLFGPTAIPIFAGKVLVIGYPPIPWFGIMLAGFACGKYFYLEINNRKRVLTIFGFAALALFISIRSLNFYGDSVNWIPQESGLFTLLSFVNITKYPPSLLFCLVTLGIMFLLLVLADSLPPYLKKIATTYGKVPLFYFIFHFYLIHFITLAVLFLQGFHWSQLEFSTGTFGRPNGIKSGLPISIIYVIWIVIVITMYKPCIWFAKYKATHKYWWLKYM
jgi:uncharacterized membrane protein